EDLGERRVSGGDGERVAVERALECNALRRLVHERGLASEGADRRAAADRLRERREVWTNAEALRRAAVGDRAAALDLVVDQRAAVPVARVAESREISGLRRDDTDVHH